MSCPNCHGRGDCVPCSGLGDIDSEEGFIVCWRCNGKGLCPVCSGEPYTGPTYHDERNIPMRCLFHGCAYVSDPYFYAKGIPCDKCAEEFDRKQAR